MAKRFADGRLSTEKILSASDEELAEMLIQVRGIGRVSTASSYSSRANELFVISLSIAVDRQVVSALLIRLGWTDEFS